MRVLTTFFTIFTVFLLLALGMFFIGREIIFYWGISSFKAALHDLEVEAQSSNYSSRCQNDAEGFFGTIEIQTQLRFTSDTEYTIEATCNQVSTQPILISKNKLPPFITKVPGGSGVIWGSGKSAVELEIFSQIVDEVKRVTNIDVSFLEKRQIIGVEDMLITEFDTTERDLGEGPVTSCEGYGFQCCAVETQIGIGESISGLTECSDACFRSCARRPLVLSFNTNPFMDPKTREVQALSGGMVDFSYVVDAPEASSVQVVVDFGDGTQPVISNQETGKVTHQYKCNLPECTYLVKIKVVDNWNVSSYDGSLNSIKVLVASP